jgi:subtilisin family serine protease
VAENSSWHGTQVSGVIAAITGNGIGMAGIGPEVRVLPVRVLGKCGVARTSSRGCAGPLTPCRAGERQPGALST